jgi:hypothetical protein
LISNHRAHAAAFGAAMNGDEFANVVAVSDDCFRRFAVIFFVLRLNTTGTKRKEDVVRADAEFALHNHV